MNVLVLHLDKYIYQLSLNSMYVKATIDLYVNKTSYQESVLFCVTSKFICDG